MGSVSDLYLQETGIAAVVANPPPETTPRLYFSSILLGSGRAGDGALDWGVTEGAA